MMFIRIVSVFLAWTLLALPVHAQGKPPQRRSVAIYLDVKETNLDKSSTVALNILSQRLLEKQFRLTKKRKDAALVIEGTIIARPVPVTAEVQKEGGVNAEASASLQLSIGHEVIAATVARSAPGDWGVQAERVGEDRLIEVARAVVEELISDELLRQTTAAPVTAEPDASAPVRTAARKPARKPGVQITEILALMQDYVPEENIISALKKYGIKFKPQESALQQLRRHGASDKLIEAVKSSSVV